MRPSSISSFLVAGTCVAFSARVAAETVQTIGAGSAVNSIDRSANFDPLAVNGTSLSSYTEGGLVIGVDGDSWVGDGVTDFDPFHGANGTDRTFHFPLDGSPGWVTFETTDLTKIVGLEFMYGNGWTTGDIYGPYPWGNHDAIVEWQSWNNGSMVSSGTIGVAPILEMGTILGFHDPAGFDQLLVRCTIATSGNPDWQALAIDNLHVQLPEPSTCVLLGGGLCVLVGQRNRKRP